MDSPDAGLYHTCTQKSKTYSRCTKKIPRPISFHPPAVLLAPTGKFYFVTQGEAYKLSTHLRILNCLKIKSAFLDHKPRPVYTNKYWK
eukprot:SAG11_NODE_30_length_23132_cov_22.413277_17_plen_88_part_00